MANARHERIVSTKKRLRTVERIDESRAVTGLRLTSRLYSTSYFECQFTEVSLLALIGDTTFVHHPPNISVGTDIVEPVIVDTGMREVGCHHVDCPLKS